LISIKRDPAHEHCAVCVLGRAAAPLPCPFRDVARHPGALLLQQATVPDCVWYVRDGLVLISSIDEAGSETSCALRGPGALLGLEAVVGAVVDYDAWALSQLVVCRLSVAELQRWAERGPAARGLLQLSLEESIRRQKERIALAGRTRTRLARFLVARDAQPCGAGPLEIERQLLARLLGMRAETFSRAVAQLRAAGALGHGREIVVADRDVLARIAASDDEQE
jgi:CRP-like cAMP-binding protein